MFGKGKGRAALQVPVQPALKKGFFKSGSKLVNSDAIPEGEAGPAYAVATDTYDAAGRDPAVANLVGGGTQIEDNLRGKKITERRSYLRDLIAKCSAAGDDRGVIALMRLKRKVIENLAATCSDAERIRLNDLFNFLADPTTIDEEFFMTTFGDDDAILLKLSQACSKPPTSRFEIAGISWGVTKKSLENWPKTGLSTRFEAHLAIQVGLGRGYAMLKALGISGFVPERVSMMAGQGLAKLSDESGSKSVTRLQIGVDGAETNANDEHEIKLNAYIIPFVLNQPQSQSDYAEQYENLKLACNVDFEQPPAAIVPCRRAAQISINPIGQVVGLLLYKIAKAAEENKTKGVHFTTKTPFMVTNDNAKKVLVGIQQSLKPKKERR